MKEFNEPDPFIATPLLPELGISLGKTNYCLKALIDKGLLKASNFRNSKNKLAYVYKLPPKGDRGKDQRYRWFFQTQNAGIRAASTRNCSAAF